MIKREIIDIINFQVFFVFFGLFRHRNYPYLMCKNNFLNIKCFSTKPHANITYLLV